MNLVWLNSYMYIILFGQILEIAHTHYWTKDLTDLSGESSSQYSQYLEPSGLSPGAMSMGASPVSSVQVSPEVSRRPSAQSGEQSNLKFLHFKI